MGGIKLPPRATFAATLWNHPPLGLFSQRRGLFTRRQPLHPLMPPCHPCCNRTTCCVSAHNTNGGKVARKIEK